MLMIPARRLADVIAESFPQEPVPPAEALFDCDISDSARFDERWINDVIAGKRWTELSATECRHVQTAPKLLSVEGFRYYLPAYLTAALEDPEKLDTGGDFLLGEIWPPNNKWVFDPPESWDHLKQSFGRHVDIFGGMSTAQRRVVLDVLRHLVDKYPNNADRAAARDGFRLLWRL